MPTDRALQEQIDYLQKQTDRYYWSVYLIIGIKDFLKENNHLMFQLKNIGAKMQSKNEEHKNITVTPDLILQNDSQTRGIIIEIKTAYPLNDAIFQKSYNKTIQQILKYDRIESGWDTGSNEVDEHCVILLPYREGNSVKIPTLFNEQIERSEITLSHPFSVWFWIVDTSMKEATEKISIQLSHFNRGVGWELGTYLSTNDIEIKIEELWEKYDEEKYRFGREPPETHIYTIMQIHGIFGPKLRKGERKIIICTVDEIMDLAKEYLPSWIPGDQKDSQLKRGWVKSAMDLLIKINLAKLNSDRITYEWKEPRKKDFREVLLEKVAQLELSKNKFGTPGVKGDSKEDKTLLDFT